MDDLTPFDRQVAAEFLRDAGPSQPVDDAAIFTAITATKSPKWRFQSMFSATKFVVAGAILALFGGFLLSGVLTQEPSDERLPAVGASASATAQAEPTDAATTEPEPTTTVEADADSAPDILPGVDLVTEEVEPGVYRVLSDGARDLTSVRDVAVAPDGNIWVQLGEPKDSRVVRLGDPTLSRQFGRKSQWPWRLEGDVDGRLVMSRNDGTRYVLDGEQWVKTETEEPMEQGPVFGCRGWTVDGECWRNFYGLLVRQGDPSVDRFGVHEIDGESVVGGYWDGEFVELPDAAHGLSLPDEQVIGPLSNSDEAGWLAVTSDGTGSNGFREFQGLLGYDPEGWTRIAYRAGEDGDSPLLPTEMRVSDMQMGRGVVGPDGAVWLFMLGPDEGLLVATWDGSAWSSHGPVDTEVPLDQAGDPSLWINAVFDPSGSLWFTPGGDPGHASLYVITPEAVAE